MEIIPEAKQNIVIARSFNKPLTELIEIKEAVSHYAATACTKMRVQNSKLQGICVFIVTNWHLKGQVFYKNSSTCYFDLSTDNTRQIVLAAKQCLAKIYNPNYRYKKVGIVLLDLIDNQLEQGSLLKSIEEEKKSSHLMKVLDSINHKIGKNTIFLASQGIKRDWQTKAFKKSPNYIGDWQQLIKVN